MADLLEEEKERSGIKNLRIKYNKVFGYYLEVTKSFIDQVPEDWMRKQTLVNAERYTTPKLKELEETITGAEDKLYTLEYNVFCEVRDAIYCTDRQDPDGSQDHCRRGHVSIACSRGKAE